MSNDDLFSMAATATSATNATTEQARGAGTPNLATAASLRKLAEVMQKDLDQKRAPRLTNTRKRVSEDERMHQEADRLEQIQRILYALADAHVSGCVPDILARIRTRVQVELLTRSYTPPIADYRLDNRRRLIQAGIIDQATLTCAKAALAQLAPQKIDPEQERRKHIQALERDLVGRRIPGFFPTPPDVIARMLSLAQIAPGMAILEPSAGKGDLADAIRDYCQGFVPAIGLMVCEISSCLIQILRAKGYEPLCQDFLSLDRGERFHRVVMNPPFESGQDIDHVLHAYKLLARPGRLVAVMSSGTFFRHDRKASGFRQWLEQVSGQAEELPPDSFKASGTGVSAWLVVIDR